MRVKGITVEDFVNYKLPSLFIASCFCDFKCCNEANIDVSICQNSPLMNQEIQDIPDATIYDYFESNPITKAIVIGGMEPMIQINEIVDLIKLFRTNGEFAPFIIYTGYYPNEIPEPIERLKQYENIIIKFGRYKPNSESRHDETLGVDLASSNQWAEAIS